MTAPPEIGGAPTSASTALVAPPDAGALAQRAKMAMLRPIAQPAEIMQVQNETRALVHEALKEGRDYGTIPGTDKPTLLKPGAERVALAFGCYYGEPIIVEQEIDHDRKVPWRKKKAIWSNVDGRRVKTGEDVTEGESIGLYRYVLKVPVVNRADGSVVGYGLGEASTMESKYIDRPRDSANTVLKMAHKRGMVSACLVTFGLSDEFTQDVEDLPREALQRDGESGAEGGAGGTAGGAAPRTPPGGVKCPECDGATWDNRAKKASGEYAGNRPDFSCRNRQCRGVIWGPREGKYPDNHPDHPKNRPGGNAPAAAPAPAGAPAAAAAASAPSATRGTTRTTTERATERATPPRGARAVAADPAHPTQNGREIGDDEIPLDEDDDLPF